MQKRFKELLEDGARVVSVRQQGSSLVVRMQNPYRGRGERARLLTPEEMQLRIEKRFSGIRGADVSCTPIGNNESRISIYLKPGRAGSGSLRQGNRHAGLKAVAALLRK